MYHADALVEWFESGPGHAIWKSVHTHYPKAFDPSLVARQTASNNKRGSKLKVCQQDPFKRAQSLVHGHVKASRARQQMAARTKSLRDSVLYV